VAYEFIEYEVVEEGIALITLNRPKRLNTLNGPLLDEVADAVSRIEADDALRVFLLTGAPRPDGRPCFGAGVDLKCFEEGRPVNGPQGFGLTNRIDDLLKPSIALVDGVCSTGSVELALACDFRLVGEGAQISDWHLKNLGTGLGGWGGSTRWSRLVGITNAKEIILTGKVVGAEEAVRMGFASSSHASDALREAGLGMARSIAAMAPGGVRLTLSHLDRNQDMSRDQALRWAELAPRWLGVESRVASEGSQVLARKRS
jgi:enoyl-CoA hydratase/carnithine racemase